MLRTSFILVSFSVLLTNCSIETQQRTPAKKTPLPAARILNETHLFSQEGRTKAEVVPSKLLGKEYLPGGNLVEYKRGGKSFRQFLVRADSPEKAMFLLMDYKNDLQNSKYLGHLGGYFGTDGDRPTLIFQRGRSLAGVIGLPEEEADSIARQLAWRLD